MNLYVRKKTHNLTDTDYLRRLKKESFWTDFRNNELWRKRYPQLTAEQLYHSYYTKILIPDIGSEAFFKLLKIIGKVQAKKGYYFINRYNSRYPFTYQGTYLLAKTEFKKSLKYILTKPIYLPTIKPKEQDSWLSRIQMEEGCEPLYQDLLEERGGHKADEDDG